MRVLQSLLMMMLFSVIATTTVFAQDDNGQTATIAVDGLSCPFCAYGLEKNLKKVNGVEAVRIDMKTGKATVVLKQDVDDQALRQAVKKAGFTAREIKRK